MPEVVYSNLKDGETMKVVIVGCGKIGRSILKNLTEEGHSVCVIDRDPKVVRSIGDDYDVMCVNACLLYTSPSPRDISGSRMPSSA